MQKPAEGESARGPATKERLPGEAPDEHQGSGDARLARKILVRRKHGQPASAPAACQAAFGLAVLKEFADGKADVTGDAAQENGRDITPSMKGNGGCPSVWRNCL